MQMRTEAIVIRGATRCRNYVTSLCGGQDCHCNPSQCGGDDHPVLELYRDRPGRGTDAMPQSPPMLLRGR